MRNFRSLNIWKEGIELLNYEQKMINNLISKIVTNSKRLKAFIIKLAL